VCQASTPCVKTVDVPATCVQPCAAVVATGGHGANGKHPGVPAKKWVGLFGKLLTAFAEKKKAAIATPTPTASPPPANGDDDDDDDNDGDDDDDDDATATPTASPPATPNRKHSFLTFLSNFGSSLAAKGKKGAVVVPQTTWPTASPTASPSASPTA